MSVFLRSVLLLFLAAFLVLAADVSGTWDAAVESSLGSGSPTLILKQEADKLSGEYSGALGKAALAGSIKGDEVEFAFKVDAGGEAITVVYKGQVSADGKKIVGTVNFGALGDGAFTATRR